MAKKHSRALELTIISGEALSLARKRPVKKNAFVVIKIDSYDDQATTMDARNGAYPSWNEKFSVDMPMHLNFLTLEVHCNNLSGDQVVGSVRVPILDFTGWCFPSDHLHFLSYRLRDRYGERNGIINISVKAKLPDNIASTTTAAAYSLPITGWRKDGATMGQKVSCGVVIGVPVQRIRY